jgi:outer membrane protein assembly factor BamB
LSKQKEKNKMQKNRIKSAAILMLLMLSVTGSIILMPNTSAHYPAWQIPTYATIFVAPDPIGVGQSVTIYMWVLPVFGAIGGTSAIVGTTGYTSSAALTSNNYRFHNYQLSITAPDGTVEKKTFDVIMDTTSNQAFTYTPTQVGTYSLNFTFPGQDYDQYEHYAGSSAVNDTYLPSSTVTTLVVQEDPIPSAVASAPLPSAYWTRPIYGEGTDWWTISSDWLGSGMPPVSGYTSSTVFHGDSVASMTAHIMWTKPLSAGGVVGGNQYTGVPGVGYFEGSCYIGRFSNPIIVDGYLYYKGVVGFTSGSGGPLNCVNLRTGEVVWSSDTIPAISFAYTYNLWNGEQHGAFQPILFTTNFAQAFDAWTGKALFNVTGVPTGTSVPGPSGEQLRYVFANAGTPANPQWYLAQWNSSHLWQYDVNPYTMGGSLSPSLVNASNGALVSSSGVPIPYAGTTATLPPKTPGTAGQSISVPYGSSITVNGNIPMNSTTVYPTNLGAQTTYDWNISVPWANTMTGSPTVVAANFNDVMLCRNGSLPTGLSSTGTGTAQAPYTLYLVNLNASKGAIGSIIWMKNYSPPAGNITVTIHGVDWQTRTFVEGYRETRNKVGFSLETGAQIWGPTEPMVGLEYYESGYGIAGALAYGCSYFDGMGGICYCYDNRNGDLLWTYGNGGEGNSTSSLDSPYGEYPMYVGPISGNGLVYLMSNEHTITDPIYKGARVVALNATTGKEVWTLSCYGSMATPAISDGYTTFLNGYDMQIYTTGKGPSSMSVEAPLTSVIAGSKAVIQGTVIDVSAGTQQDQQAADFPNGVPVASDQSMTSWMQHVYQQKPLPTNFTGVTVSIDAIDPNNNYLHLGDAKTNEKGLYSFVWTPPDIPGVYDVTATFAGTNGYWPSQTETTMVIESPAGTATPQPVVAQPPFEMYVAGLGAAIIIAIAVVGLVIVMIIKKK